MKMLAAGALSAFCCFAQQYTGGFERTLQVSGPVELDVKTDSGGIFITPGPVGSVHVKAILRSHRGRYSSDAEARIREIEQNPPVEQSGNRIRVGHLTSWKRLNGISMRLEITTPQETSLKARADSGGIQAKGIRGPADVATDSGGIEIENVGGEVRAAADSGGIRIRNVQGKVDAKADSGGIEAYDVAGAIVAVTDSGGIRLGQTAPGTVSARADSGGVKLKLAPNAGYDLAVSSDSGRVHVPEITVRGAMSNRRVEGKVRGGGPLVKISVDSGNIDVE